MSSFACSCSSLVCALWQKTRPNRKRRPFTSFCFLFFEKFLFVPVSVCPAARKSPLVIPLVARVKTAWEFGRIAASAASPLATSPHAHRSREISAAGGGSPKPAGWLPSSRVAAPPGAPFAGDHATGSPLTQCPPDHRWLMPAGSPLTHARRPPLSLAPWI